MHNRRKLEELAELVVEVHRHLHPLEERSKALKDELRHYEGQSHQTKDGSTVKKTFLASATAVALVGGGYGYLALVNDGGLDLGLPGLDGGASDREAAPIAMALTPAMPKMQADEGMAAYDQALAQIDAGEPGGLETLKRAANLGHAPAQAHLASLYQNGDVAPVDLAESRRWARRAAEGGDPRGMHIYAMELYDGVGGERNRAEAMTWLQRAAERGLVDSQYNVARLYENGDEGIAPNPTEALKWYMIAARGGDQPAQEAVTRLRPTASATAQRAARAAAETARVSAQTARSDRDAEAREREARERWARRSIETAQLHPEPAVSRTELILEDAPVWRQYRVRLCRVHHARRAPSQAAASGAHPRDAPTFQFSFDPPLDYYKVTPRTTADDVLFPPRRLRVQLPSQRLSRAVHTVPRPPVCASVDHHAPFDDTRLLRAMVGDVESDPMHALFAEDEARVQLPGAAPPRRRAPRVKLPPASSWRQRTGQLGGGVAAAAAAAAATSPPPLGSLGYPGLFQRPLAEPFAPLLDGAAQGTWGTSPLTFPLIAPAAPETLDPLKSVWTQSDAAPSQPAQPKNSLREIADDALPAPLPLSMHELRDDERAPSKLDVFASPFQPGAADAPRRDKWAFRSTLPPYYMPTYPSRRRDETDVGYALPTDYSEFLSEW